MEKELQRDGEAHETNAAVLGKITPVKVPASRAIQITSPTVEELPSSKRNEQSLLLCVQRLMRDHGLNYSTAAIRDLPDMSREFFNARDAISAFVNNGFLSSGGELSASEISAGYCPCICFTKTGDAFLLLGVEPDGKFKVASPLEDFKERIVNKEEFTTDSERFVILVKRQQDPASSVGKNNWFWGSLLQGRWLYVQVILAAAVANILSLASSIFVMVVYDRVVPNEAIESLIALTIGVLLAIGFEFVIKGLRASFIDRAGKRADARMTRLIFDKLLAMRLDKRRDKSGALASVVREFETLRDFFTSATLVAVVDLPFVFLFIYVIYLIAGPLAWVPLISVPLVIITGLVIQPILARLAAGAMETGMSKQAVLVETLNGLETVQATGSGRLMRKRFEEASEVQSELGLKNRLVSYFAINLTMSLQQLAQVLIVFYGVFLIQDGTITMGAMIAASIIGGKTLGPLTQLATALTRANSAREAFRSLNAIMNDPDGRDENTQRLSRPVLKGEIEFKNVTYTFPGAKAPVIRNVSLKITPGQKVAVVGKMGSGKSTLARLAAGLIEPTEGSVLIDGVDLRQIDRSDVRRNIGVMLQETWLFSGTLRENIQMGYYEYDDQHILNVARVAGVDDFVAGHPSGYDLPLRERGEGLSGGQRQSINLARALLHDPNLLILDEPTSSMDTATEAAVLDRLNDWLALRTLLVVTHRNSLLKLSDRVLVMDQGSVVADTTPDRIHGAKK